jgi:hypothetical protein
VESSLSAATTPITCAAPVSVSASAANLKLIVSSVPSSSSALVHFRAVAPSPAAGSAVPDVHVHPGDP